jgi:HNH endonuclease
MTACKDPIGSCPVCGDPIYRRGVKTCSSKCGGELRSPRSDREGYIYVTGGKREHVVVAETALGRGLPHGWEVHHANEIKADNSPGNLIICQSRRLHRLLHVIPDLLKHCVWLGEVRRSVRLFANFEPKGRRYCLKCRELKSHGAFGDCTRDVEGIKSVCLQCISDGAKAARREYRKTHPRQDPVWPKPKPGEKNPAAKLTAKEVRAIRKEYAGGGVTHAELGVSYGVSRSTITLIVSRKKWKHL